MREVRCVLADIDRMNSLLGDEEELPAGLAAEGVRPAGSGLCTSKERRGRNLKNCSRFYTDGLLRGSRVFGILSCRERIRGEVASDDLPTTPTLQRREEARLRDF